MNALKKILIVLFGLIIVSAGSAFWILNSSGLTSRIVPFLINRQFKDIKINGLSIAQQRFIFPDRLELKDIKMKASRSGEPVVIEDADVEIDLSALSGSFFVSQGQYSNYKATDIKGVFNKSGLKFTIAPLTAKLYGGTIAAEIVLAYSKDFPYSINLKAKEIGMLELEEINQAVFSNMKGKADADLHIVGTAGGITNVSGSVWSPKNAQIKAVLLKPLLDYIPQSTQKKELDLLIKEQGNIPLETAVLKIENYEDEKLATRVDLKSEKFNLDIGVKLDLNIEGGMKNLMSLF
ncbi:MAG: hypothetical protein A2Z88_03050 [Omnitrophica WOR_2 bacterium GWA2_47_8]|nr:MAG: hypothetical protein A2Z88_03050 [Omnitrophica WOR_2 bacterium GWA2_47_8]